MAIRIFNKLYFALITSLFTLSSIGCTNFVAKDKKVDDEVNPQDTIQIDSTKFALNIRRDIFSIELNTSSAEAIKKVKGHDLSVTVRNNSPRIKEYGLHQIIGTDSLLYNISFKTLDDKVFQIDVLITSGISEGANTYDNFITLYAILKKKYYKFESKKFSEYSSIEKSFNDANTRLNCRLLTDSTSIFFTLCDVAIYSQYLIYSQQLDEEKRIAVEKKKEKEEEEYLINSEGYKCGYAQGYIAGYNDIEYEGTLPVSGSGYLTLEYRQQYSAGYAKGWSDGLNKREREMGL